MAPTITLRSEHRWTCPNCTHTDITAGTRPHTRFHTCPGLRGLTAPMIPAGTKAKVDAVPYEDYEGPNQQLHYDSEGQAMSAVVTTRDDGNDTAVLAPCALGRFGE